MTGIHERDNIGYSAPIVQLIEAGMPPAHKLLGDGSGANKNRYLGEPGKSEEPEADSENEGRAALHRLLKEGFSMEEGGPGSDS